MAVKVIKPTTPGRRQMIVTDYSGLSKTAPEKRLTVFIKNKAGRNNTGKITVRRRGGGHKRQYRIIDFKQTDRMNIEGRISSIEYDPNRSCFIALTVYKDGDKRYHLVPRGMKIGDRIMMGENTKIRTGNRLRLRNIPPGIEIYNVEINPGRGGQIARSAGANARLVSLESEKAQVQLPSGEIRLISKDCFASIGGIGNEDRNNRKIGKAGRMRWMRKRPKVRGKAMNPVDHPHGGGEGNQPIGLKHPKTPWGAPALGKLTRKRKYSDTLIIKRRKKNR